MPTVVVDKIASGTQMTKVELQDALVDLRKAVVPGETGGPRPLEGGEATIWWAGNSGQFAIKVFKKRTQDRAVPEFEKLQTLQSSSYTPRVYGFGKLIEDDGVDYLAIVEEYVQGTTLADIVKDGKLTGNSQDGHLDAMDIVHIVAELTKGIRELSRAGLAHRDISPNNVLLGDGCVNARLANGVELRLIDFGVSSEVNGAGSTALQSGVRLASIPYSAPEMFDVDGDYYHSKFLTDDLVMPGRNSSYTDVWSIGAIIVFLIWGEYWPEEIGDIRRRGSSSLSIPDMKRIAKAKKTPIDLVSLIQQRREATPRDKELAKIVLHCTEYVPSMRFPIELLETTLLDMRERWTREDSRTHPSSITPKLDSPQTPNGRDRITDEDTNKPRSQPLEPDKDRFSDKSMAAMEGRQREYLAAVGERQGNKKSNARSGISEPSTEPSLSSRHSPDKKRRTNDGVKSRRVSWTSILAAVIVIAVCVTGIVFIARGHIGTKTPASNDASTSAETANATDINDPYHQGLEKEETKDYKEAARLYRIAADEGHAEAQYRLGTLYRKGRGVEQNYGEAARLYALSAEQGSSNAQNDLGYLYREGLGVDQDYGEAARLFSLSADQGNANAQCNLAALYRNGMGVEQNYGEAARLYGLSADQGNAQAQNGLGFLYWKGLGVEQNYDEAARLFGLSADQDNANAQCNLGRFYEDGLSVRQDYKKAVRLYKLSADQGFAAAQRQLGHLLEEGLGVEQDYDEAARLYRLAAAQGDAQAKKRLDSLTERGLA